MEDYIMEKNILRTVCLFVCLLIILCPLASCSGDKNKTEISDTVTTTGQITEIIDEIDPARLPVEFPDVKYNGEDFVILTGTTSNPNVKWLIQNTDEENAELINDAIYKRNRRIEEQFNIIITQNAQDSPFNFARKSIMSGDKAFDIAHITIVDAVSLARQNLLYNFIDIPYIDTGKAWWDQNLENTLTIEGKLYFQTGDITVYDDCRTACMYFNKGLFQASGLPFPYDAVLSGDWTFDYLIELTRGLNKDLDGDGVMGQNDQWGYMSQYANSRMMFQASGESVVSKNSKGEPELTMNSQRATDVIMKILTITTDGVSMFHADMIKGVADIWQEASKLFQEDKYYIRSSLFEAIPRDLRGMETDFGVLPYPKYDKQQERYYSQVYGDARVIAVPKSTEDIEKIGIMTESLAYGSVDTLTVAFFDLSLIQKNIRDDESKEMLDIIFSSKKYDIGDLFAIGGYDVILDDLTKSKSLDFMSKYEAKLAAAQIALDKLIDDFANAD